jgi:hypothetical protein
MMRHLCTPITMAGSSPAMVMGVKLVRSVKV